jgi:chromosome segregation ATPase
MDNRIPLNSTKKNNHIIELDNEKGIDPINQLYVIPSDKQGFFLNKKEHSEYQQTKIQLKQLAELQEVSEKKIQHLNHQLTESIKQKEHADIKARNMAEKTAQMQKELNKTLNEQKNLLANITELTKTIIELRKELTDMNNRIHSFYKEQLENKKENNVTGKDKMKKQSPQITLLQKEFQQRTQELNEANDLLQQKDKEIEKLRQEIGELNESYLEEQKLRKDANEELKVATRRYAEKLETQTVTSDHKLSKAQKEINRLQHLLKTPEQKNLISASIFKEKMTIENDRNRNHNAPSTKKNQCK